MWADQFFCTNRSLLSWPRASAEEDAVGLKDLVWHWGGGWGGSMPANMSSSEHVIVESDYDRLLQSRDLGEERRLGGWKGCGNWFNIRIYHRKAVNHVKGAICKEKNSVT